MVLHGPRGAGAVPSWTCPPAGMLQHTLGPSSRTPLKHLTAPQHIAWWVQDSTETLHGGLLLCIPVWLLLHVCLHVVCSVTCSFLFLAIRPVVSTLLPFHYNIHFVPFFWPSLTLTSEDDATASRDLFGLSQTTAETRVTWWLNVTLHLLRHIRPAIL